MINLREQAERDLADTLEGEFALPIRLIDPDGAKQDVEGQVVFDTIELDPSSGAEQVVHKPVATVRRSSLSRVPEAGEAWAVQIPTTPSRTAPRSTFLLQRPSEDGGSIGFVRLYLIRGEEAA
jgi:hypothetical protein